MYRLFAMTPDTHFHIIVTTTLSGKVKQRQLLSRQLILKAVHISKNPIRIVFNPCCAQVFLTSRIREAWLGEGIS